MGSLLTELNAAKDVKQVQDLFTQVYLLPGGVMLQENSRRDLGKAKLANGKESR